MFLNSMKLPLDICYGSIAFFVTILHNIFLLYHVDVFVSVYRIDKSSFWIGEMVFLLWNSLNDPLFGWLSDRQYLLKSTNHILPPALKRLSALKCNGPLLAVSFIAFWIPWIHPTIQFVVCLCLYDSFLTMIDLHHSALLADLTVSAKARTKLNSRSSFFSALGSASVFLSYAVWNKDNLTGFRVFCIMLSIISLTGFVICSKLLSRAYFQKEQGKENQIPSISIRSPVDIKVDDSRLLWNFVSQLSSHHNFRCFALMNLVQVFHCHFNSNFFPLFLENLLGDTISAAFGSFLLGISFVAPHVNNLYFLLMCQRCGVYFVITLLFITKLMISLVMFALGPSYVWVLCLFIASNRVFTEGTCKLLNLVISDLVDEDFVIHKRRQPISALIFGTAALLSKPGQTLAPLIGIWFLNQQTGHDIFQSASKTGSIKMKSEEMQRQGSFNLLVHVPIFCAVIQLVVWTQFTLRGSRLRQIKSLRTGSPVNSII